MFEGLGLGTRLAFLPLPKSKSWIPYVAAAIYAVVTPIGQFIFLLLCFLRLVPQRFALLTAFDFFNFLYYFCNAGMAIGLGVRHSYQPNSPGALIASGVLDSISAGLLLYAGLVELLAHEFLFSPSMQQVSPIDTYLILRSVRLIRSALPLLKGFRWKGSLCRHMHGTWNGSHVTPC